MRIDKKTLRESAISGISRLSNHKILRKPVVKGLEKLIWNWMVEENPRNGLREVEKRKFQFASSMLHTFLKRVDEETVSTEVMERYLHTLVGKTFFGEQKDEVSPYEEKYGEKPPGFIVLSPTQICNLNCIGCYAESGLEDWSQLKYETIQKILKETHDKWNSRFTTISGGEPFMYKDTVNGEGKNLFDIFSEHPDMFFLTFTNGTLLAGEKGKERVERLAELGNVTPAISVEGFKEETDERRAYNKEFSVHEKVLSAFENLRETGVPFGISVTPTTKNLGILLGEEKKNGKDFYEYYFDEQGALYGFGFQLMPIGRAADTDLTISAQQRKKLFRKYEELLENKNIVFADFWSSGIVSNGCIAYGRPSGGFVHINPEGGIQPCTFVQYYVDKIQDLHQEGKGLSEAIQRDFFKRGREWQRKYGYSFGDRSKVAEKGDWTRPCSIRDNYDNWLKNIHAGDPEVKPSTEGAKKAINSEKYAEDLGKFDRELEKIFYPIWRKEFVEASLKDDS